MFSRLYQKGHMYFVKNSADRPSLVTPTASTSLLVLDDVLYNLFLDHVDGILTFGTLQCTKEIFIWAVNCHILLWCHPRQREAEVLLLQVKFHHLEGFHQDRADAISSHGVSFRAGRKHALGRHGGRLNRKVIHRHREKRGEYAAVQLGSPVSDEPYQMLLVLVLRTSQYLRTSISAPDS
jgi:hypothetical protein